MCDLFMQAFKCLPIFSVLNGQVIVKHDGAKEDKFEVNNEKLVGAQVLICSHARNEEGRPVLTIKRCTSDAELTSLIILMDNRPIQLADAEHQSAIAFLSAPESTVADAAAAPPLATVHIRLQDYGNDSIKELERTQINMHKLICLIICYRKALKAAYEKEENESKSKLSVSRWERITRETLGVHFPIQPLLKQKQEIVDYEAFLNRFEARPASHIMPTP